MDAVVGFLVVAAVLAAWLVPVVISFAKGHVIGGVLGILGFTPIAWIMAALLAKPDSGWAQRFYGPEKMARARRRYPAKPEPATPAPVPAVATEHGVQTVPANDWSCLICGEEYATRAAVEAHVRGAHAMAPVDSSIAAPAPAQS